MPCFGITNGTFFIGAGGGSNSSNHVIYECVIIYYKLLFINNCRKTTDSAIKHIIVPVESGIY